MTDRVALISGGGGDLGSAVARLLAERGGWQLALVDNRADSVETEVAATRAMGTVAESMVVDLSDPLRRIADPVEIARMCVWRISEENTYATDAELYISGGLALH